MADELVSKKTRNEFREFLVGWTLRQIADEFDAAGIKCNSAYQPPESGQRRSLVEQYYHTLDFTNSADVRKLLTAYESILTTALDQASQSFLGKEYEERTRKHVEQLVGWLKRDGFKFENGKVTPITPETRRLFDGQAGPTISEVTRRNIFDALRVGSVQWAGRLSEPEFLARLYDLDAMPSTDHRFREAASDIRKHRVNNPDDWPADWVFTDSRFSLMNGPDGTFLRFLCEMVHPVVQPDEQVVRSLVATFNAHLAADGWEIFKCQEISGKPIFGARSTLSGAGLGARQAKAIAEQIDAGYVHRQITRMEQAVDSDPELAIGTAKEFIETICRTILSNLNVSYGKDDSLTDLAKKTAKELKLAPDDIADSVKAAGTIRVMLSNLAMIAKGLAELRNPYGTGHGKHAQSRGLRPRHARLAVGAATCLGVFLFETHSQRTGSGGKEA